MSLVGVIDRFWSYPDLAVFHVWSKENDPYGNSDVVIFDGTCSIYEAY